MGKSNGNIVSERIADLLNVEKLIAISLDYTRKMIRAFHYNNESYKLPIPSVDEGRNICYRLEFLREWDNINSIIRNKKNEELNKLSILDNPHFADVVNASKYPFISKMFEMLKDELKDNSTREFFDPKNSEEFSIPWSIAKVFDLIRDIFSLIEIQLSDVEKSYQNTEGNMMTQSSSKDEIVSLLKYFNAIPNIVQFDKKNIVVEIKSALDKGVFKEIFKRRMEGVAGVISPSEVNIFFEQYIKGCMEYAKIIQSIFAGEKMKNISAGTLLKEYILETL